MSEVGQFLEHAAILVTATASLIASLATWQRSKRVERHTERIQEQVNGHLSRSPSEEEG